MKISSSFQYLKWLWCCSKEACLFECNLHSVSFSCASLVQTPAEGASTTVYAAAASELEGLAGLYLYNGQKKISSASSYDKRLQEKLWAESCAMVGLQKA